MSANAPAIPMTRQRPRDEDESKCDEEAACELAKMDGRPVAGRGVFLEDRGRLVRRRMTGVPGAGDELENEPGESRRCADSQSLRSTSLGAMLGPIALSLPFEAQAPLSRRKWRSSARRDAATLSQTRRPRYPLRSTDRAEDSPSFVHGRLVVAVGDSDDDGHGHRGLSRAYAGYRGLSRAVAAQSRPA